MKHSVLRGSDLHSPSNELVENNTGSVISKFKAVKFASIGMAYPEISLANGGIDVIRGITQTDIANGGVGYITALGFLNNVNTSSWAVGTKLYAGIGGVLTTSVIGLPVAYVLKQDASNGTVYVANTGVSVDDVSAASFPADAELEMTWAVAYPTPYKEFSYNVTGDIVDYNVYADNTKAIQIFNKHFSYNLGGNLTQIVTTNLLTLQSKTKAIAYDLDGEMISMTES
jgi:hypothetical protein